MRKLIAKLAKNHELERQELLDLVEGMRESDFSFLLAEADRIRRKYFGDRVYFRGLLEFTSYCRRDCLYCGLRVSNKQAARYRLTLEEIRQACAKGYSLGYRTFVLQGGEDAFFTDDKIVEIIKTLKSRFPDCAITLSLGEKTLDSYRQYFAAGADRYLLRHETASETLYNRLHPGMSLTDRKRCLQDLMSIGYQVGAGCLVGLPGQTGEDYVDDLLYLKELGPHMVGIGPFIPHHQTPLAGAQPGTVEQTLLMLALTRLLLPHALLPATTALGTIDRQGREKGLQAGANVVMPNISPPEVRPKYALYDGKICLNEDVEACGKCLSKRIAGAGYAVDMSRGDSPLAESR